MGAVQRELPAVVKVLLQVNEQLFAFFIVIGPVRRGVKAATIAGCAAVRVPARQAAPGWAVGIGLLKLIADRKRGRVRQIGINHAVDKFFLCAITLNEAVIILIASHEAAAHVAGFA